MIDGIDNNERIIGTIGVRPSIDAIQEVNVSDEQVRRLGGPHGRRRGGRDHEGRHEQLSRFGVRILSEQSSEHEPEL